MLARACQKSGYIRLLHKSIQQPASPSWGDLKHVPDMLEVLPPLLPRMHLAVAADVDASLPLQWRVVAATVDDAARHIHQTVVGRVGAAVHPRSQRVHVPCPA
eukprot:scaffold28403_cov112-Isochrysis_galbana.AAC.4